MIVTIQYSFFDYRTLIDENSLHPIFKRWPHVLSGQEFIPSIGVIQREKSDLLSTRFDKDDQYFITAKNFLKFQELPSIEFGDYYPLYRRVKFSKKSGITLLLAFKIKLIDKNLSITKVRSLLDLILSLKIRFLLKNKNEERICHLFKLSNIFKRNFYDYISKKTDNSPQYAIHSKSLVTIFRDLGNRDSSSFFNEFTHQKGANQFNVIFLSEGKNKYPFLDARYRLYRYSKLFQCVSIAECIGRLILSRKILYPNEVVSSHLKEIYATVNELSNFNPRSKEELIFINKLENVIVKVDEVEAKSEVERKKASVKELIPKIKKTVQKGGIDDILTLLNSFIGDVDKEIEIHVLLIIFRIRTLNRNFNLKLISHEDLNVGINRIIYTLLQFEEL